MFAIGEQCPLGKEALMPTSRHVATLLFCAGILLACSAEPTPDPILAPHLNLSQTPANAAGPSASGHANVTLVPSGALRTFSFHARVMPDGSVEGEYENHNRQLGSMSHGDIDCLRFIGTNRAVMSGTIRRIVNNPGGTAGGRAIFTVEDNGEGANDPPDRVSSILLLPPGSNQDCSNFTNTTSIAIEGGNIRVDP
jgi:hypothetical protein